MRFALAGSSVPPSSRIALEIEYRLDSLQVGHNAPDLDDLIKATIDAMDGVLGYRPGRLAHPQADDERIVRIVASKRIAGSGEKPGARVVIVEL